MCIRDRVYAVYRNTSTWQSNFTFSNRPSKSYNIEDYLEKDTWDIVSYNPSTGQQTGVEKQPIFTADITHLVNDWYTGAEENNGIYNAEHRKCWLNGYRTQNLLSSFRNISEIVCIIYLFGRT